MSADLVIFSFYYLLAQTLSSNPGYPKYPYTKWTGGGIYLTTRGCMGVELHIKFQQIILIRLTVWVHTGRLEGRDKIKFRI